MRALAVLCGAALFALAVAACNGGASELPFLVEISPTPTETVTAASSPVATIPPADMESFRAFAVQLDEAIVATDVQFFVDNVMFEDVSCEVRGIPGPPESCDAFLDPRCLKEAPAYDPEFAKTCPIYQTGATAQGILGCLIQSECGYLDPAGYEQSIREFLTNFDAGASDAYGDGEPRLYAYAIFRPEFQIASTALEEVQAIATSIVSGAGTGRGVRVFSVGFDGQDWSIIRLTVGGDPITVAQFLEPTGPTAVEAGVDDFFQFWERWEGTP